MVRWKRKARKHEDVLEVGGEASTDARLLGRGVDGDEDEVCLGDSLVNVGREEEVAAAGLLDNVNETGLVDGQLEVGRVPCINTRLVQVDDRNLDVGALERDDSAGRPAYAHGELAL